MDNTISAPCRFNLYVIGLPVNHQILNHIEEAIKSVEPSAGRRKNYENENHVTKFDMPWQYYKNFHSSLQQKLLYATIFYKCLVAGWRVQVATDIQRFADDSLFIFEYIGDQQDFKPPISVCCVSTSSNDKLQLISHQNDSNILQDSLSKLMKKTWGTKYNFTNNQREHNLHHYKDYKVTEYDYGCFVWSGEGGSGWGDKSKGKEILLATMSMGNICSELGIEEGWKYLTNGSVKGRTDYVWFVKYEVDNLSACPNYYSLPYYEIPPPSYDESFGTTSKSLTVDENVLPAMVQLYRNDKIRLCGFNNQVVQMIVDCLEQVGGLHVQKVNDTDYINIFNGRTIQLTGTPWWCSREKAVISRWALAMIFEVLRLQNWSILTALDLSIALSDKSTFIFVKSAMSVAPPPNLPENSSSFQFQNFGFHTPIFNNLPSAPPKPIHSMVISLTDTDHLRFIGHYSDQDLENWMKPIRSFAMGLKMEEYVEDVSNLGSSYDRCYKVEFKLCSIVWW